jgi:cyclophilin family peptidyl-prolyl cis-trans isomerase
MNDRHKLAAFSLSVALLFTACSAPKYPEGLYAEVTTNKGMFVFRIEFEKTPMTASNFVGLAEGTIDNAALPPGTPYFDGTKWHRVVPGHVIQCGIPRNGKDEGPGYQFPNEIVPELTHGRAGMVNMANGGPHTNASQWCVMLGDRSYLDGDYTVWGEVIGGMDVVQAIVQDDEIQTLEIVRVGEAAQAFRPTTETFKKMVEEAKVRVQKSDAKRKADEEAAIDANWPDAVDADGGLKYVIQREGRGRSLVAGTQVRVAYSGRCLLSGEAFVSTTENGRPHWGETPAAFDYEIGETKVTPGFDAAVAQMKPGEKRLVIVPSSLGYGTSGFYATETPGEKRFVISPNTVLVYEIEIVS